MLNKRELEQTASNYLSDIEFKALPSDSTWRFKKTLLQKWLLVRKLKQSITESSKTNQYDLDRQTTKVSAFLLYLQEMLVNMNL